MKLKLILSLNNAAFFGPNGEPDRNRETARILHAIATKIENDAEMEPGCRYVGFDINGNRIGEATITR